MKFPAFIVLAALALAGPALAQPGNPGAPMASDFEGATTDGWRHEQGVAAHDRAIQNRLGSVQKASSQMQLACAADRARLCSDEKTSFSADRCVESHRSVVTQPCRTSIDQTRMAWGAGR